MLTMRPMTDSDGIRLDSVEWIFLNLLMRLFLILDLVFTGSVGRVERKMDSLLRFLLTIICGTRKISLGTMKCSVLSSSEYIYSGENI